MSRGLLLAAHGSRDVASQQSTQRIADLVRGELPGVGVVVGYLEQVEPNLSDALTALLRENESVTVVPLLFAPGRHNDVDIPGLVRRPNVTLTPPLGADPLVAAALRDRLIEAELPAAATVVVVSAGSKDPTAISVVEAAARLLTESSSWTAVAADALTDLSDVVASARATGAATVAVSPLLLAPGAFAQRITAMAYDAGADVVSDPIGDHPAIAVLVAKRYAATTEVAA